MVTKMKNSEKPLVQVVAYARTSSEDTASSFCGSIEQQFEAIDYWAKFNNCEVIGRYKDEDISGLHKNPPGLTEMVDDIDSGRVWAFYVVVCQFNRITRNISVYNWYKYTILTIGLDTISLSESCTSIPELLDHQCRFSCEKLVCN